MKMTNLANLLVTGLVLAMAVTGCQRRHPGVTPLDPAGGGAAPTGPGAGDVGAGARLGPGEGAAVEDTSLNGRDNHAGWLENAEMLKAETVYFAYDSAEVRASELAKVGRVADALKAGGRQAVRVEGHCDERGTEEYNRSLGERRALAVREELIRLGADPGAVDTISYGEDRPVAAGQDEGAWQQNRRAEFIVLTPP